MEGRKEGNTKAFSTKGEMFRKVVDLVLQEFRSHGVQFSEGSVLYGALFDGSSPGSQFSWSSESSGVQSEHTFREILQIRVPEM